MSITAIDDAVLEAEGRFHACLEDVPQKSAQEMKEFMDYVPRRVIIPKLNDTISALSGKADAQSVYSSKQIDGMLSEKADAKDLLAKDEILEKFSSLLMGRVTGDPLYIDDVVDYPHTMDVRLVSKNLIPCIYGGKTQTVNGITFTMGDDGSVFIDGTATASASFTVYFKDDKLMPDGMVPGEKYTVYCEPDYEIAGGSFIVNYYTEPPKGANYNSWVSVSLAGAVKTSVLPENAIGLRMYINIPNGVTVNGVTVRPMIERGSVATGVTVNIPSTEGLAVSVESADGTRTDYFAGEDGKVEGVTACYPTMTLYTSVYGVLAECVYRRDIDKAFNALLKKMENGG